jgi:hypothetical protein
VRAVTIKVVMLSDALVVLLMIVGIAAAFYFTDGGGGPGRLIPVRVRSRRR